MRANRVYLLFPKRRGSRSRNARYFLQAAKAALERRQIEVEIVESGEPELLPLLSAISDIIVKEKREKNIVYVNMSAAGKLTAVAATLAAMYHDVRVYYVVPDGGYAKGDAEIAAHGMSVVNEPRSVFLTNFTIDIPGGDRGAFLVELYRRGDMSTGDIVRMIRENRLKGFEDLNEDIRGQPRTASNLLMRINRGLLDELERKGYIQVEKKGQAKTISITDKGKYAACLIGQG